MASHLSRPLVGCRSVVGEMVGGIPDVLLRLNLIANPFGDEAAKALGYGLYHAKLGNARIGREGIAFLTMVEIIVNNNCRRRRSVTVDKDGNPGEQLENMFQLSDAMRGLNVEKLGGDDALLTTLESMSDHPSFAWLDDLGRHENEA